MTRVRALVADDDPQMVSVVSMALHRFGADVVPAESGGELLETIANHGPFDVIVTDISMPWMTGLQVMQSARTAGLSVPVVVMTARRDPTLPAQVRSLGGRSILLHKPFSLAELYEAIRGCLAEPSGATSGVTALHGERAGVTARDGSEASPVPLRRA